MSKMFLPHSLTSSSTLNDKAAIVASTKVNRAVQLIARGRDNLRSSMRKVMGISLNEMVEVNEAKNTSRKNSNAHTYPPVICWKIPGKTSKINLGPAVGSKPKENTAGKIITPDRIATSVSITATVVASLASDVSSLKYEL